MLALPARMEALYDSTGQHLGGVYPPLMVDGVLTPAYAGCLSTRPAELLIYQVDVCPAPWESLGLVWMMPTLPEGTNPLAASPAVLPYLVQVLDAGCSVKLHAARPAEIEAVRAGVGLWLGGGRA